MEGLSVREVRHAKMCRTRKIGSARLSIYPIFCFGALELSSWELLGYFTARKGVRTPTLSLSL